MFGFANQTAHLMTGAHEMRRNGTADKTARACNEYFQDLLLSGNLSGNLMTGKQYPPSSFSQKAC
jgi:hypothetical protein